MKLSLCALLLILSPPQALMAQTASPTGNDAKPVSVTSNFQVRVAIDPSASTTELAKALAKASQSLADLADKECDALAAAFKSDCRVIQLNMGANIMDSRRQFNNDSANGSKFVNASLNATFELAGRPAAAAGKAQP